MYAFRIPFALLAAVLLPACGGNIVTIENEEKSFETTAAPRVVLKSFNGTIKATAGSDSKVVATVIKRGRGWTEEDSERDLDRIKVTFSQDGDKVSVIAERAGIVEADGGVEIEVSVPAGSTLDFATSNGTIETSGITGPIKATSSNGRIDLDGCQGEVDVDTSNGDIDIRSAEVVSVKAETSNGAIDFAGKVGPGSHSFSTSNGAIRLKLPSDAVFHFEGRTSNGNVTSEFGLSNVTIGSDTVLEGDVGESPETSVIARTSNGAIRLQKL